MVTSLNTKTAARDANEQQIAYIACRLTAAAGGGTIQAKVGALPAGAVIVGIHSRVFTTFAGGSPVLAVGQVGVYNDLATGIALTAGGVLTQPLTTIAQPLAADTEVWCQVTGGATAGDAVFSVWFMKPLN